MRRLGWMLALAGLMAVAAQAEKLRLFAQDGTTMVPMRYIAEWLGATVGYDATTKAVTLTLDGKVVALRKGLKTAAVDGKPVTLTTPPAERDGVTYVPVRFVSEAFGAAVRKSDAPNEVSIVHPKTREILLLPMFVGPTTAFDSLHIDAYAGLTAQIEKRLAAGADVNGLDSDGMPPLAYAIMRVQAEAVTLLLEKGARADFTTGGLTLLHLASMAEVPGMSQDPDRMDAAAQARMKTIVAALVEKGADVKRAFPLPFGTPLHALSGAGQVPSVEYLIEKGADVNATVEGGVAPLHLAVVCNQVEIVTLLLDKGANINAKTDDGGTPMSYAKDGGSTAIVDLLKARGAKE